MAQPSVDFKETEEKIRKFWEKEKVYKFDQKSKKKIYSIDTAPPTVSGKMHIGHAFSYSQQDFIVRFQRMIGKNVFYPFGTDDNGLATERLVEKEKNVQSKRMHRDEFIKLCLDFLKTERPEFIQDWKNIGISSDFDIFYSTIDDHSRKISQWSFLDLYKKNRIYRKDAPAMWCPNCQTGVAQVEVQDKEQDSTFNDILFKVGGKDLVVATTRPELLPACAAIFYHPTDKRFKSLKGKMAKVPLFDFEVPIMEDARVDPKKGTGIVMCCTFGDQTDMEWQKAYNLPIRMAITSDGRMSDLAGKYQGLKLKETRKKIIEDLKKANLIKGQKPIKHAVNVHERCGVEIEFIKSKQWFVRYLDLKKDLLKWGAEMDWYPLKMKNRYDNWVKGLQWDWLISNQRHFGVAFPVWYCGDCDEVIFAEESKLPVDPLKDKAPRSKCPKCKSSNIIPEKDVLNTWFTSSMTPQIAIQLMPKNLQKKLFPMDLRSHAHDIITFWLFNTVLKSQLHFGKNPWKKITISGFVTKNKEKMSKSKGNIVKPQDVMEQYGADALRFWAASSKLGEDSNYQEKDLVTGRKFVNKLKNATRFVFMNLEGKPKKPKNLEKIDELFLNRLQMIVNSSTASFENYDHSRAKLEIENFFWKLFCDNYLEIVKKRIYQGKNEEKISAQYTLYQSLLTILKLIAPIMPFVTEEIYQEYFRKYEKIKSIHISDWPKSSEASPEKASNWKLLEIILSMISEVRQKKSEAKKSMNSECKVTLDKRDLNKLGDLVQVIKDVMNIQELKEGKFKVEFA